MLRFGGILKGLLPLQAPSGAIIPSAVVRTVVNPLHGRRYLSDIKNSSPRAIDDSSPELSEHVRSKVDDVSDQSLFTLLPNLKPGQIYEPEDFKPSQIKHKRMNRDDRVDMFDYLQIDPLHCWKHYNILSSYVSTMGRILPRRLTGLSPRNQRRLGKAIRRARACGIMPAKYQHLEKILYSTQKSGFVGAHGKPRII